MVSEGNDERHTPFWRRFGVICFSYLGAAYAATVVIAAFERGTSYVAMGNKSLLPLWLAVVVFALPVFLATRWVLMSIRHRSIAGYIIAGAINGLITPMIVVTLFFEFGLAPWGIQLKFGVSGAVGGAAFWWLERTFGTDASS